MKIFLKSVAIIVIVVLATVLGYLGYMQAKFYRIEDNIALDISNHQIDELKLGQEYTVITYNIGFGAYSPEYSFFMDKGNIKGEKLVSGKYGKAISKEDVEKNINGSLQLVKNINPDFALLQEVDTKADRSYFVNQKDAFVNNMKDYSSVFAENFHSPYLFYPFNDPHGAVNAGLLSLSKYKINSANRRSLPIDMSFITKFTDLDRCLSLQRINVESDKELVLINAHLSAYDEGGIIRKKQFELLNNIIDEEYQKGNYVIVGGDYNHALLGSKDIYTSNQDIPSWVSELDSSSLNENASIVPAKNLATIATCRACDIPYTKGINYTTTVDGFIVSKNVEAIAENIDNDFKYSDHNPVKLTFRLN